MSKFDQFTVVKDLNLFARKLVLKKIFANKETHPQVDTNEDFIVLQTLQSLLDKQSIPESGFHPLCDQHQQNFHLCLSFRILKSL